MACLLLLVLTPFANLPDPDVLAAGIAEDLQAARDQFSSIAANLSSDSSSSIRGHLFLQRHGDSLFG